MCCAQFSTVDLLLFRTMPRPLPSFAFLTRYILHTTLIICSCCYWDTASAAKIREPLITKEAGDSLPSINRPLQLLKSRSVRSTKPELGLAPTQFRGFSADRKEDGDLEDGTGVDSYPAELPAWNPNSDGHDLLGGDDVDKRKWGDNKARMWGKRKWGENRARVWGKRLSSGASSQHRQVPSGGQWKETTAEEQRVPTSVANFVNRFQEENQKLVDEAMSDAGGKRKWGDNKARVWGK